MADHNKLLDDSVLTELFGNDPALHAEVLAEFRASCDGYLTEFDSAWQARNADALQAVAHKLKSSASTVGAVALAPLCGSIEVAAKSRSWVDIDRIYEALPLAVMAINKHIEHILNNP